MKLSDLIDLLIEKERKHSGMGYTMSVEVRDEQGMFTGEIQVSTEVVFHAKRITIRLEPKESP